MTNRPRRFAAKGFGFALAIVAFSALGASSQAVAAAPLPTVTPRADVGMSKIFAATVKSSLPARRGAVDIDPIDPNVRHFWPNLVDTSDAMARNKS